MAKILLGDTIWMIMKLIHELNSEHLLDFKLKKDTYKLFMKVFWFSLNKMWILWWYTIFHSEISQLNKLVRITHVARILEAEICGAKNVHAIPVHNLLPCSILLLGRRFYSRQIWYRLFCFRHFYSGKIAVRRFYSRQNNRMVWRKRFKRTLFKIFLRPFALQPSY